MKILYFPKNVITKIKVSCGPSQFLLFTQEYFSDHSSVTHAYLIYCLKSSLLLAFCFLFVCMVDQTQMCPSCMSALGLFQGICNEV